MDYVVYLLSLPCFRPEESTSINVFPLQREPGQSQGSLCTLFCISYSEIERRPFCRCSFSAGVGGGGGKDYIYPVKCQINNFSVCLAILGRNAEMELIQTELITFNQISKSVSSAERIRTLFMYLWWFYFFHRLNNSWEI